MLLVVAYMAPILTKAGTHHYSTAPPSSLFEAQVISLETFQSRSKV